MSNHKTPSIRFKGFTDDWEQRKLGDVATFINGRAYSQPELLSSGKYKVLRVGNFYTNDSWYYSDLELGEKYYADYGDLLYTWSATFGPHIWLGDRVIYHYHIWKIDLSNQLEKQFAVQLLEQDKANILSSKNGSTMVHITKEGMEQKDVIIPPSTKEQQEIGAFFQQLDNLITLHQRKYEKLVNVKKSMLDKMFPKNDFKVPEIRFKGFTDDWEQRKVSDLLELLTDYDANGSFADMARNVNTTDGTGYAWYVRMTDLENPKPLSELKYVDEASYKFLKKTELHGGELLMAKRGNIGKAYIFEPRTPYATVAPNMYLLKLNDKVIPHFLYNYFISSKGNNQLVSLNASSTMGALYKDDVKNINVIMPSIEEQQKIGEYFSHLDNLITLHQRELEKLQNLKKSLLNSMFI